ncbi:hypothetical protein PsorP6_014533 [Peronosclerospora sorghi]|uniref:Uncharacterized protein n=1 Tax=Peronosclerospora sorghi TaxID=230839 RepID=A0ACC0VT45_9STRA|nr:hypothetical protein PsorP6_014533 [Peronosclerospora sorghi]
MVETRRTSRRLQKKATTEAVKSSPPASSRRQSARLSRLTPSPSSRAKEEIKKKKNEKKKEIKEKNSVDVVTQVESVAIAAVKNEEKIRLDRGIEKEEEEPDKEKEEKDGGDKKDGGEEGESTKEKDVKEENKDDVAVKMDSVDAVENEEMILLESVDEKETNEKEEAHAKNEKLRERKEEKNDEAGTVVDSVPAAAVGNEEMTLLDNADEEEEKAEEEEEEEEDIEHYALLAASGLTFSTKGNDQLPCSSTPSSMSSKPPTAAHGLPLKLVSNQLESGASRYQAFFDFERSKRPTLREDARALEEQTILAASHKEVAHSERQRAEAQQKQSAGRRWFNFESEVMTPDARQDFALLQMRNYLDPKKFYKSSDHSRALPKYFQRGVVLEAPHEFHSARLSKKQRRKTFTDEIMADEQVVEYTHRVATAIQIANRKGGRKRLRRT